MLLSIVNNAAELIFQKVKNPICDDFEGLRLTYKVVLWASYVKVITFGVAKRIFVFLDFVGYPLPI